MRRAMLFGVLVPILLLTGVVLADTTQAPSVDWWVLSSGGAPATGGSVALNGTLGQTAIGASTGTGATVGAGFWYGLGEGAYEIYLPVVLRKYG